MGQLNSIEHKQKWFTAFLHIFNHHWDKIDNFRIDKYLMVLRHQFNALLTMLKENKYQTQLTAWYQQLIFKLLVNAQKLNVTAAGIALQICDVFVQELNNVDKDASLEILVKILDPFLRALGKLTNGELKERITDNIFKPLLENNKTMKEESSDEEE